MQVLMNRLVTLPDEVRKRIAGYAYHPLALTKVDFSGQYFAVSPVHALTLLRDVVRQCFEKIWTFGTTTGNPKCVCVMFEFDQVREAMNGRRNSRENWEHFKKMDRARKMEQRIFPDLDSTLCVDLNSRGFTLNVLHVDRKGEIFEPATLLQPRRFERTSEVWKAIERCEVPWPNAFGWRPTKERRLEELLARTRNRAAATIQWRWHFINYIPTEDQLDSTCDEESDEN